MGKQDYIICLDGIPLGIVEFCSSPTDAVFHYKCYLHERGRSAGGNLTSELATPEQKSILPAINCW